MRIIVTGGSGKLGRAVVARLTASGHDVFVFDRAAPRGDRTFSIDLTDYGHVLDAVLGIEERHSGVEAIVHLAAIPAPGVVPDAATFENNMLSTYHVLQAARRAGVKRIVTASSETVLGLPFDVPPDAIPVTEDSTRPESTYSMVKHLEEQMAITFCRWDPALAVSALRFSNVMDPDDYDGFGAFQADARLRKWNLWGYIDARDGATAVERALTRGPGFDRFVIAAADTVMERDSAGLAAEVFPDVPLSRPVEGRETLLSIDHARAVLGWEPTHSWRDPR